MKIVWQNVLVIIAFFSYNYLCLAKDKKKPEELYVGGLFDEEDEQAQIPLRWVIRNSVLMSNDLKAKIDVVPKTDCFSTSKILCNMTEQGNGLAAIFGPQSLTTAPIAQSIATTFQIPHIQTNWRHSASYSEHDTVVNFYPDPDKLAFGLSSIVTSLQWKTFVILYENDDGLIRMQEILKLQNYDENINTVTVKQLGPGPDYRTLLKEIRNSAETQFILDCETDHILPILQQAKEVKLLEIFHKYFLTSLDAHTVDLASLDTNANITTVRIFDPESHRFQKAVREWEENENMNEEQRNGPIYLSPYMIKTETALMYDAASTFANSLYALRLTGAIKTLPLSCDHRQKFEDGLRIYMDMIKRVAPSGILTAPLQFNRLGQRINFQLYLIQGNRNVTIATWSPENPDFVNLTESGSDKMRAILQNLQKETVIVASRIGAPYLMPAENPEGKELQGKERYEGYSRDLLDAIAKLLEFNYDFHIVQDYGSFNPKTKQWNGLIKELLDHRAHLAICDLTITHQRRSVVDFSMPFMTLGISILYKQESEKEVNMFAFLDPFSIDVWIYTATLYLTVSVILFFIARMAPGDWENPHPCEQNPEELENIWDLKNCLWLTLGSIMTQGCDILPKGISSRMATSMWWFFSLIMTSSYTANLAAFLTTTRLEAPIDGAEALSKQTKIKYGVVAGGATEAFFRESNFSTYQRMWTTMLSTKPSVFQKNNELGVRMVQNDKKGQYAFLMESSQIEYEIETKCDLKQVGTWLDSKGYGIAMPVNSAYRSAINTAILKLQEDGELQKLKNKWWKEKRNETSCSELNQSPEGNSSELALANVGGVFLVLGVGVAIAFIIAILEFLWNVKNVAVEEKVTYCQALKVELIFAMNVWITKKRVKPQVSESSSSSSSVHAENGDSKSMTHSILQNASSFVNLKFYK